MMTILKKISNLLALWKIVKEGDDKLKFFYESLEDVEPFDIILIKLSKTKTSEAKIGETEDDK